MENYYYHISRVENFPSIMAKGINANKDGQIFLFDDVVLTFRGDLKNIYPDGVDVADHIAKIFF